MGSANALIERPNSPAVIRTDAHTLRDYVAPVFRHRRLALTSFLGIVAAAVVVALLTPSTYEARMRILVKNSRVDPLVSPAAREQQPVHDPTVSETELNSEVELLKSNDVLTSVVGANGLEGRHLGLLDRLSHRSSEQRMQAAVQQLGRSLSVEPILKTNIIQVRYRSSDPERAANVLKSLATAYVDKHLNVHRPAGEYKFFDEQAQQYKAKLEQAQAELEESGAVAPQIMRDHTLDKLSELSAMLATTRASIGDTQQRIRTLRKEESSVPTRLTTQQRRADNASLMQQLKSTLANLQLKRTELLAKYQPTYRTVQEVDQQISDLRAMITREESAPVRDVVTDQNPTHVWVGSELAKSQAELAGLKARAAELQASIGEFEKSATDLDAKQELQRAAKEAQDNYDLYVRKREEARISDELDRSRILNVAIADAASVPALPVNSRLRLLLLGLTFAFFASATLVFLAEYFDSTYRTPRDIVAELEVPVLAAIPEQHQLPLYNLARADESGAEGLKEA